MGGSFKKVHAHPRVGLAGSPKKRSVVKRDSCSSSDFYTSPTAGESIDSSKKTTFTWSTKCIDPAPQYVDLYLYAPAKNDSMIQAFDSAKYTDGKLETTLDPNWWGLDANVSLQLQIVSHGSNQFMSSLPTGPVWTATYDSSKGVPPAPSSGSPTVAQRVKNIIHAIPGGSVAAAVIFPLLFVAGIAFWFIRRQHKKTAAKTNRFSTAIDKRMSTISTDWRSMSGAGANAAIRQSVAIHPADVDGRPSSVSITNQAGIGALRTSEEPVPQMEEMRRARQSVFTTGERQSRISFAPDVRNSYAEKENPRLPSAVRGLNARSFHQAHTSFEEEQADRDLAMSPTQAAGPTLLHPSEIEARASTEAEADFQREVLQMPAMTLMRTGGASDSEFVLPATTVTPPASSPAYTMPAMPSPALQPNTPMSGMMPVANNGHTGAGLSPDDLLRAYAAGRPLASPSPVATPTATMTSSSNGGMRILYQTEPAVVAPQYPQIQQQGSLTPGDNNPFRKSMAAEGVRASQYTESMYSAGAYETYGEHDEAAYETEHYGQHHDAHYQQQPHGYGHAQ